MRSLVAAVVTVIVAVTCPASAEEVHATAPRSVDFAGGLVVDAPLAPGVETLPGLAMELRWFAGGPLWFGAGASFEAGADLRDPERGSLISMVTTGVSSGVHVSLARRVEVLAGVRVDGVRVDGVPMSGSREHYGVRGGPQVALGVMIGRAWGHPMSIEARAGWLVYPAGGPLGHLGISDGWQAGLHVVGVLFPDR
ncbi:MAG: hypothetical protein IPQ07_24950 [Myxococcales bacterium]|nr:hypothetical protein [Myxococcales bacterium]